MAGVRVGPPVFGLMAPEDSLRPGERQFLFTVDVSKAILAAADDVLERLDPGIGPSVAAVLAATALEHAVNCNLQNVVFSRVKGLPQARARVRHLTELTLPHRMRELARLNSAGRLELNRHQREVLALEELIAVRNRLVHQVLGPIASRAGASTFVDRIPWQGVTKRDAHRYIRAVEAYTEDVAEKTPTQIRPGRLLSKATASTQRRPQRP